MIVAMTREAVVFALDAVGLNDQMVIQTETLAKEYEAIVKLGFTPQDPFGPKHSSVAVVPHEDGLIYYCITNANEAQVQQWAAEIDAAHCDDEDGEDVE